MRTLLLLALLLLTVSLGCSLSGLVQSAEDSLKTEAAELGATAVSKGESFAQTQAAALLQTARAGIATGAPEVRDTAIAAAATAGPGAYATLVGEVERPRILNRARSWVADGVPYDPAALHEGYRTDSAGYVAYAWFLEDEAGEEISPDAAGIASAYATTIAFAELQPGDAIGNQRPGDEGLVVIFASWQDELHSSFDAYVLGGPAGVASQMTLTLQPDGSGGYMLAEAQGMVPGPFFAMRRGLPE